MENMEAPKTSTVETSKPDMNKPTGTDSLKPNPEKTEQRKELTAAKEEEASEKLVHAEANLDNYTGNKTEGSKAENQLRLPGRVRFEKAINGDPNEKYLRLNFDKILTGPQLNQLLHTLQWRVGVADYSSTSPAGFFEQKATLKLDKSQVSKAFLVVNEWIKAQEEAYADKGDLVGIAVNNRAELTEQYNKLPSESHKALLRQLWTTESLSLHLGLMEFVGKLPVERCDKLLKDERFRTMGELDDYLPTLHPLTNEFMKKKFVRGVPYDSVNPPR
jgi:hypothetical protein